MVGREQLAACGLSAAEVERWADLLAGLDGAPEDDWRSAVAQLRPDHPFALHRLVYEAIYGAAGGPVYFPAAAAIERAHVTELQTELRLGSYEELYAWSITERAAFWEKTVQRLGICFKKRYEQLLHPGSGGWLAGAELNIAESCFQAPAEQPAIVYQREGGAPAQMSYGELEALCDRVAHGLGALGLRPGDRVAIDMPMTAEAVAIYLGTVKAGCAVVAIADSFAAPEIATRLRIGAARAVFTQDVIVRGGRELPLYPRLVAAQAPRTVVLDGCEDGPVGDLRPGDLRWADFLGVETPFAAVSCAPEAITNILFSSGTTGDPKALPWTHANPIKCGADSHYHLDIHPREVVAWPTNLGWMMGPWLIYASFLNRATMALYYGAPNERGFGSFVQAAGINMLGVIPSLVRTWRRSGCMEGIDFSAVRVFCATGECSNAEDMHYLMALADYRPVLEYCGGTELAGGYLLSTAVVPVAPSIFNSPTLGTELVIADEDGRSCDHGEVFLVPPAMGMSTQILNRDHHEVYYAGAPTHNGMPLRRHGDQVERLAPHCFRVHGRADDAMNLGGIKVSSAEIERVLNAMEGVAETAAIAVSPPGGGPSLLVVYAVLEEAGDVQGEMQQVIRRELNPLFKIHEVVAVGELPRTASNKVMRRVLRERYGEQGGAGC